MHPCHLRFGHEPTVRGTSWRRWLATFVRVGLHLPSRVALSRSPCPDAASCKMPVSAIDTIDYENPCPVRCE